MRSLAFCLTALTIFSAAALPASAQRLTGARSRGGSAVRSLQPPTRTVPPVVNRSQLREKLPGNTVPLRGGQAAHLNLKPKLAPKLNPQQFKIELDSAQGAVSKWDRPKLDTQQFKIDRTQPTIQNRLQSLRLDGANKLDLNGQTIQDRLRQAGIDGSIKTDRDWQSLQDRLHGHGFDGSLKDRMTGQVRPAPQVPGRVRGVIIIPGRLIVIWRPLWWRPYPYFVPIPVSPGPVPICVHGSSTPVVVQSPAANPEAPSAEPPKPDLAIIMAHCPLPTVVAGQEVGPVLQVAAACLATEPVDGVAVDVFLTKDPDPAKHRRPASYSPGFSDGALLKDGREVVSFPGNGLLNVPMTGALTIPADTPSGDYYLGVAIDAAGQVTEADETNNVQFIPVRIVAAGQAGGIP